jgi:hypothetical protein
VAKRFLIASEHITARRGALLAPVSGIEHAYTACSIRVGMLNAAKKNAGGGVFIGGAEARGNASYTPRRCRELWIT